MSTAPSYRTIFVPVDSYGCQIAEYTVPEGETVFGIHREAVRGEVKLAAGRFERVEASFAPTPFQVQCYASMQEALAGARAWVARTFEGLHRIDSGTGFIGLMADTGQWPSWNLPVNWAEVNALLEQKPEAFMPKASLEMGVEADYRSTPTALLLDRLHAIAHFHKRLLGEADSMPVPLKLKRGCWWEYGSVYSYDDLIEPVLARVEESKDLPVTRIVMDDVLDHYLRKGVSPHGARKMRSMLRSELTDLQHVMCETGHDGRTSSGDICLNSAALRSLQNQVDYHRQRFPWVYRMGYEARRSA
jgi:hypothetical protein